MEVFSWKSTKRSLFQVMSKEKKRDVDGFFFCSCKISVFRFLVDGVQLLIKYRISVRAKEVKFMNVKQKDEEQNMKGPSVPLNFLLLFFTSMVFFQRQEMVDCFQLLKCCRQSYDFRGYLPDLFLDFFFLLTKMAFLYLQFAAKCL